MKNKPHSREEGKPQPTLEEWAGSQHLDLTLVFTDIVDSTAVGIKLGDKKWIEILFSHFSWARDLASIYDSYVVKVIGDSLMMAFRASSDAIDFSLRFALHTGVDYISVRIGINSGQVQIRENDIYGLRVNFASRLQHKLLQEGILVSPSVKTHYEDRYGPDSGVRFVLVEEDLKSFGKQSLWRVEIKALTAAVHNQKSARLLLLGTTE